MPCWEPIGTREHPFQGIIEGNGAVFKNLIIENELGQDLSIFGYVCDSQISDFTIAHSVRLLSLGRPTAAKHHHFKNDTGYNLSIDGWKNIKFFGVRDNRFFKRKENMKLSPKMFVREKTTAHPSEPHI